MTVKRAHMVTRGYLAAWANGRDLVFVADAEAKRGGVRSLRDATVVSYAYRTEMTTLDLEAEYGRIESDAVPALKNLAQGGSVDSKGVAAIIRFLDMHIERGRWADQAAVRVPVGVATVGIDHPGSDFRMAQMGLGDRLVLSRNEDLAPGGLQLSDMRVERWRWRVVPVDSGLVTGDGAVIVGRPHDGAPVNTVCFPLSPTRLLVVGNGLDGATVPVNAIIASQCRRWLVDHVEGDFARGRVA